MLSAIIYFEKIRASEILGLICDLPAPLKPLYYSEDEDSGKDELLNLNVQNSKKIMREPPQKYFLISEFCRYHILLEKSYVALYIDDFNQEYSSKIEFLVKEMSKMKPFFGCICESEEWKHRNRIYKTIGNNQVESWVGRNPFKLIPGLYWKTIFSESILRQNNLETKLLQELSQEVKVLEESTIVVTFYSDAQDWRVYKKVLDSACLSMDGIFSREEVLSETDDIGDLMQYITAMSKWK